MGRVCAGSAQDRAAAVVDVCHIFQRERHPDQPAFHQVFEAVEDAEHLAAALDGFHGGGIDHAVDTRGWSAAHKYANFCLVYRVFHGYYNASFADCKGENYKDGAIPGIV